MENLLSGLSRYDNNMEMDIKVNDILREVIAFLECLRDAQLPLTLESLREKLLVRSKNTLMARPSSPEPYLDMKSGPRSLLLTRSQADSEEYVGMEESQRHSRAHTHQDYYETFGNENQPASASGIGNDRPEGNEEEQMLIGIYKNLSATQVRSKCYKCGSLYRKEGKKLFLSESRACWMALVGSHLLIYRSDRHNRPYAIYPIRGYMARAAPNIIPRDRRKSESAFEMYRPGNETLQFIARGPKDMEQWIAKISDVGCEMGSVGSKKEQDCEDERPKRHAITTVESSVDESKAESASKEGKVGQRRATGGKAPPLPARIPRRLPSLPPADPRARLDDDDDGDDDDIYHRIEDLRNGDLKTRYQNMVLSKKQRADAAADQRQQEEEEAYDDVAPKKRNERNEKTEGQEDVVARDATSFQQTYDDIGTLSRIDGEAGEEFYDDVQNLIPNRRFAKDDVKDQIETSKLEKKSFLDRVLSRRDSPEKSGKRQRHKGKVDNDDASDLELPEYNCLPPPRPIYQVKLSEQTQEFYDDVQERRDKDDQQIISPLDTCCNSETEANRDELEHYQLPRSDSCVCDATEVEQDEQLYDDIALWADFTARQRDVLEKRDKKTWNRFAANRKSRVTSDLNNDDVGGADETEDSPESNGAVKRNTFQKLISRMENSLAKVSARSPSSLSAGKPNVSSSSQV
ncbi:PREDICTED: FK506-binding protein 5-like [Vollenhovia emeryi]|uniref:FK506-binding protein 5-like n=1 Tax=Vollenhovia emeryi TaxID=411798 RepID=UPI0005F4CC12|nr:PREDICTED: FK506-binding protein 5-like [Vollenhovia emeryi]